MTHTRHAKHTGDTRAGMWFGRGMSSPRGRVATAMTVAVLVAMVPVMTACSNSTGTAQTTDASSPESDAKVTPQAGTRDGGVTAEPSAPQETPEQQERRRQEALKATISTHVAPSPYEEDALLYGNEPLVAGTSPASTACGISMASDTAGGTVAFAELSRAIADIEAQGYTIGMSMCDLAGTEILAYNADDPLYPASAIKGPYVLSVWRDMGSPSGAVRRWTENIFGWSDNDSYHAMQDTYGGAPLRRLAEECGLGMSWYDGDVWSWSQWYYPRTSAADMSQMWVACSEYVLDMGNDSSADLREFILDREVSPMRDGLGGGATTYAKAGWISEGGDCGATPAAVDSGIVLWPDGRSYVLTIMTNTEEDMDAVATLAACADRCHFAMTNPDSERNAMRADTGAVTSGGMATVAQAPDSTVVTDHTVTTGDLRGVLDATSPTAFPRTTSNDTPVGAENELVALRSMLP